MSFLPVAERELRVAARKRSTFWTRITSALVALVIGGGFLFLTLVGFGFGTAGLGAGLFGALTWLGLAAALLAGLFFTSDCLSEEKREGTLGFLFLTDLRGYDVVLGKLLATSLRCVYALLAVFPILAITLIMGGVTGAQFWKTMLALLNALSVSLIAGLFVSAISRDPQKALGATLFVLLLLVAAGPAFDAAIAAGTRGRSFEPLLSLSSPGYVFVTAGAWGRSLFWEGLMVNQLVAWTLFGLACFLLPKTWQEKARTSSTSGGWGVWWKFGGSKARAALRRKLINLNPALWLACRNRWPSVALWVVTILMVGGLAATIRAADSNGVLWFLWNFFSPVFVLILYLWMASHSGRFFGDARRSGLMELLLTTPLTVRQIVHGQWRGTVRMFAVPLVLCLVAQSVGAILAQQETLSRIAAATPPVPPPAATSATNTVIVQTTVVTTSTATGGVTAISTPGAIAEAGYYWVIGISVFGSLTILANLIALLWVGMWMGLTSKNSNVSTLKTMAFVQIIPWFVVSFASMLIVPLILLPSLITGSGTVSRFAFLFPFLSSAVASLLFLIKDIGFSIWARRRLYAGFRERASLFGAPGPQMLPPPLPLPSAKEGA